MAAIDRPAVLFDTEQEISDPDFSGEVLLVDDDETIRSIGRSMLEELGFEVITANDGREALEKFSAHGQSLRFVLMDLTMPHLDGEQAFREMRRIDPRVKVILSSGYNQQEVSQKFVGKGLAGFLKKPYQLSKLQDAIRQLFSAP
jgi:CheY-like chemotaxis protein